MKKTISFLISLITTLFFSSQAYAQEAQYKGGEQCKCISCKCSTGSNKGANCACGTACKCALGNMSGMSHSMSSMAHNNVFLSMMDSMMIAMDAAPLDASAEGDFLRQMIPHHQGAIEMANYEIANGSNKQMIQLAKSILTEQQSEIAEMKALLTLYPFKQGEHPSPVYKKAMDAAMEKMMTTTPSDQDLEGKSVDCCFAMVMLPHHQAAVDMSTALLKLVTTGQVATYAARIISDQQIEIQQMEEFIQQNCK